LAALLIILLRAAPCAAADDFDTVVAPLLRGKCLACQNRLEKKGGLDLSGVKSAVCGRRQRYRNRFRSAGRELALGTRFAK